MPPSPAGTTEVMSSIVSVVQRLSRPYRTQFCSPTRNPAMNRWAILIGPLRDRVVQEPIRRFLATEPPE